MTRLIIFTFICCMFFCCGEDNVIDEIDNDTIVPKFELNIKHSKTDEKFLKLEWDIPELEKILIDHYEVTINSDTISTIIPYEQNYYIDSTYIGGLRDYKIAVVFEGDKYDPSTFDFTASGPTLGENDFSCEISGTELFQLRLEWTDQEYACNYVITSSDKVITHTQENFTIVDLPAFPFEEVSWNIYFLPVNEDVNNYLSYPSKLLTDYSTSRLGVEPQIYDFDKKLLIAYDQNQSLFQLIGLDDMNIVKSAKNPYPFKVFSSCGANQTIATMDNKQIIRVFKDFDFENYISKDMNSAYVFFYGNGNAFKIHENNTLQVGYRDVSDNIWASSYSLENLEWVNGVTFTRYGAGSRNYFPEKGDYFFSLAESTDKTFTIYKLSDWEVFYQERDFSYAFYFNPLNENEMIVCDNNPNKYFRITDIATHITLKEIPGMYLTSDRYTGNILRVTERVPSHIYSIPVELFNSETNSTLTTFSITREAYENKGSIKLIDNKLFYSDYYLDLSIFLNSQDSK